MWMKRSGADQGFAGSGSRGRGVGAADGRGADDRHCRPRLQRLRPVRWRQRVRGLLAVSGEAFAQARYASDAAACEALCRAAQASWCWRRELAVCARCGGRGAPAGRIYRYAHHGACRREGGGGDALVLSPAGGGGDQPRSASVVPAAGGGHACGLCGRAGGGAGGGGRGHVACVCARWWKAFARRSWARRRFARTRSCCLWPARDGRRSSPTDRSMPPRRREDPRLSAARRRIAGQQQVAGGPEAERRRPAGAAVPDSPEPDRTDGRDAAPSPRGSPPAAMARSRTWWAGASLRERRAISLDPNCGWARGKADVVYVADAFEVMARVNALLESRYFVEPITAETSAIGGLLEALPCPV